MMLIISIINIIDLNMMGGFAHDGLRATSSDPALWNLRFGSKSVDDLQGNALVFQTLAIITQVLVASYCVYTAVLSKKMLNVYEDGNYTQTGFILNSILVLSLIGLSLAASRTQAYLTANQDIEFDYPQWMVSA
mmetsp:Transcript_36370/g.32636  ORF Transcript_36370/g.32636 Transcript_36370/m.32636 type:complete len:134 (-) Transcript_36370:1069-1470(-)